MTTDFARTLPILASLDIAETSAFYVDWLGFSVGYEDDNYLIVKRDEMELHFWKTGDRRFPENTSCYIRGGQVAALHEEYSARGVPKPVTLPGAAVEHEGIPHPRPARQSAEVRLRRMVKR